MTTTQINNKEKALKRVSSLIVKWEQKMRVARSNSDFNKAEQNLNKYKDQYKRMERSKLELWD